MVEQGVMNAGENPVPPRPLTGGVGPTALPPQPGGKRQKRPIPQISLSPVEEGYAVLLAEGWDTIAETYNMSVSEALQERLEAARLEAEALDLRHENTPRAFPFGGETLQIYPRRPGRGLWVLACDDFQITFRSPAMEWAITVRYSSAGLWEWGWWPLRNRVLALFFQDCSSRGSDWTRISEAHWCWDFHSPAFSEEFRPRIVENVVCHSSTKKSFMVEVWARGSRGETLTIGKKGYLQVQVYDKGQEITDASGKTWMFGLWERSGWRPPEDGRAKDVWRLEVRMYGDFLKDRGVPDAAQLELGLLELLTEALVTRRLTSPSGDRNRWRWPMHPLWVLAWRAAGGLAEMRPLGRQVTEAGDAIMQQMIAGIAGTARAACVLRVGDWDPIVAEQIIRAALTRAKNDPAGKKKVEKLEERYRYVAEAR